LLIELAGNSRNESGGHENRGKNQSDADNWPGEFFHRLQRGVFRCHPLFYMSLNAFNDHDGIVHDETDGKNQAEQRERIDRKTEQWKQHERADQ